MTSFKEVLSEDLDIFIDEDEFANRHTINGVEVVAIVNTSNAQHMELATVVGVFTATIEVYLKQGSLSPLPRPDSEVVLDGLKFRCYDVVVEQGIDILKLYANR